VGGEPDWWLGKEPKKKFPRDCGIYSPPCWKYCLFIELDHDMSCFYSSQVKFYRQGTALKLRYTWLVLIMYRLKQEWIRRKSKLGSLARSLLS
jgi:hypothetical protein